MPSLAGPILAASGVRLSLLALVLGRCGAQALNRPDTNSYLEPGRNLLFQGRFIESGMPEIVRTPGYPLFLALSSLAGPIAAALMQVLLSVVSVVLVWRLARAVFRDQTIALIAAWLFAFEPLSITYSILLLPETLFLALWLLSLERLVVFLRGRQLSVLAAAGIFLAAAAFVRPVAYYLPIALALGLAVVMARDTRLRWRAPAVLLLATIPWLAAWQVRNYVETGFGGFSSIQQKNLYFFTAAEALSRIEHRPLAEVQDDLGYDNERQFISRTPAAVGWNQAQRIAFIGSEAVRILRAHPAIFLRNYIAGEIRVALNPGAAVLVSLVNTPVDDEAFLREREQGPVRAALWMAKTHPWQMTSMAFLEMLLLALYALAVIGVARSSLRHSMPNGSLGLLLGVSLYFLVASAVGAVGAARFRLPVMPVVCVMAAAGTERRKSAE
jgi:4-amino-4-deoxy-L-arabinose transferase-like glycosyltransferase